MCQFKLRVADDVVANMKNAGWLVDKDKFNNGEYIKFVKFNGVFSTSGTLYGLNTIMYNPHLGSFSWHVQKCKEAPRICIATHASDNLKRVKWYSDLLKLIYKEVKENE